MNIEEHLILLRYLRDEIRKALQYKGAEINKTDKFINYPEIIRKMTIKRNLDDVSLSADATDYLGRIKDSVTIQGSGN